MWELEINDIEPIVQAAPESNRNKQFLDNGAVLETPARTFQLFTFHKTLRSLLDGKYKVLVVDRGQTIVRNIVEALAVSDALAKCGVPPAQAIYVTKLTSYYGVICPAEYTAPL